MHMAWKPPDVSCYFATVCVPRNSFWEERAVPKAPLRGLTNLRELCFVRNPVDKLELLQVSGRAVLHIMCKRSSTAQGPALLAMRSNAFTVVLRTRWV